MRIVWIGQEATGGGGDEIYDRKILAALASSGIVPSRVAPRRVSRLREVANLAAGVPYYRARYLDGGNRARLAAATEGCDVAVCSWEPFDALAATLPCPVIPILHNITSAALPSMFAGSTLARIAAARAAAWERRTYASSRFAAIAVLSRADEAAVRAVAPSQQVLFAPPGMPPLVPLDPSARFTPELVISGSYDWRPKRRDVMRFAQDYVALPERPAVLADDLPPEAAALLAPRRFSPQDASQAIRLGIVTDRFLAGHKLKATYYLAMNAIVLSFADLGADFREIEDHAFFVRHLGSAGEIARHVRDIAAQDPDALRRRLEAFKARCAARFSWAGSAAVLAEALERATRG